MWHIVKTFLKDASLRIEGLKKIEKKILRRFSTFLSWLGIPSHFASEYPPHVVAKIVADLALQFKINLDQIRESEERRENIKTKKVQRRSAPNLRYSAVLSQPLKKQLVVSLKLILINKIIKMTGEISLAEEVKTLQRHMGLFSKAFKDLSEKVKSLEERTKCDQEREIKEIIESQRAIDEIIVVNSDAIKKLNFEIAKVQEQKFDEKVESSTKAIEQRLVKNADILGGHCR